MTCEMIHYDPFCYETHYDIEKRSLVLVWSFVVTQMLMEVFPPNKRLKYKEMKRNKHRANRNKKK